MKRLIPLFMLLGLLLCGCGTTPVPPEETAASGDSLPHSAASGSGGSLLEERSEGDLQIYPLDRDDCTGMLPMGSDLILFAGNDPTLLIKISGTSPSIAARTELESGISPENAGVHVSEKGVTYYDSQNHQLVFLDTSLKEVSRFSLPEDIQGSPALSADRRSLYYCTANQLKVLDLETGLTKLLKEMFFPEQTIGGLHCGDSVVECDIVRDDGAALTYFFSAETGETLWEAMEPLTLTSSEDFYFALRAEGAWQELLTGSPDLGPWAILFDKVHSAIALPEQKAALLSEETADGVMLHYFDLTTGKRTAQLALPAVPRSAVSDDDQLWLLYHDESVGSDMLCRWDPLLSPTGDETVYTGARITAENPDTEGLLRCRQMAEDISKAQGVDIRIWTDAIKESSQEYALTPEYHVSVLEEALQTLQQALDRYPQGFLKQAAQGTSSGAIRLCILRSIESTSAAMPDSITGMQFWNKNEDAYVCLEAGAELERSLYREIFHIIESRVMSSCSAYDNWNALNPDGFEYDYDYLSSLIREDSPLTKGENRAFIDCRSMSFPAEDRAILMEYAMTEGNEDCFSSPIMQQKLQTLCAGIRQAFRLQDSAEVLPWEQYLKNP